MSSQKGNVRPKGQKHQNSVAYDPMRHSNPKKKKISETRVVQVCQPCRDVIQWKIKYGKYKPITQPRTCVKCSKKNIKHSYHTICLDCNSTLKVCCKCGKSSQIVQKADVPETVKQRDLALLENDVKTLPLRHKRTYRRYIESLNGFDAKTKQELDEEVDEERLEMLQEKLKGMKLDHTDFLRLARAKFEELQKRTIRIGQEEDESDSEDEDNDIFGD